MTDYFVSADVRRDNPTTGAIVAKIAIVLTLAAVQSNAPPQYTGPSSILDLVVGVGRQLQGFDPDGDTIVWSIGPDDAAKVSVTSGGILTAITPMSGAPVTVFLDDGKP